MPVVMRERHAPSRPYRQGNPRRQPKGASRSAGGRAPSLDTSKQVATTVRNWMQAQETHGDKYRNRVRLWRQLCVTVYQIWQDYAGRPKCPADQEWFDAYCEERDRVYRDESPEYDAWLDGFIKAWLKEHAGEAFPFPRTETYVHVLYLENWKKVHKPIGINRKILNWEKQYFQLLGCQGEWIGYRAECCGEKTQPIAVPIGCNHRLCPLCPHRRSQNALKRTKALFDRLTHPQFLTLTTPNLRSITKRTFNHYRKKVRALMAMHPEMFRGGVYAIETTYNRREATWHIHAHVLVDATYALPAADWKIEFAGRRMRAFDYLKHVVEFDWTRLWCASRGAWDFGKKHPRKNASKDSMQTERLNFEWWVRERFENRTMERDHREKRWVPITGLSASEMQRREQWNRRNRRVVWIKPVDDRERAAKEVLKYITKCAEFSDLAGCVETFHDATKGARLIQTFGSWYGVALDVAPDHLHPEDWAHLKCSCGQNWFVRMGLFYRKQVNVHEDGRYVLKPEFNCRSAGTVARPTIRALDERVNPEDFAYGYNSSAA